MPYEEIPIAHVLNYWLADRFDASDLTDVLEWLGEGKTIADMLGAEASTSFYTRERRQEIFEFVQHMGLDELQYFLNDQDDKPAVLLRQAPNGELVFAAGIPEGTPAIATEWFSRHRAIAFR